MQGYYQYPTIFHNTLIFLTEEDLFRVPLTGGEAFRLTSGASAGRPCLSPDGTKVAFSSELEGSRDLYVMDLEDGGISRLTYLGGNLEAVTWAPDSSSVIFSTDAYSPFPQESFLYSVLLSTKQISKLPLGPAVSISFSGEGESALCRNAKDLAHRKRNRGGGTGEVWVKDGSSKDWRHLDAAQPNCASPIIINHRVYFVSDTEGHGELYSCTLNGGELRKESSNKEYYVRYPSTNGSRIVYQAGGEIFLFDPKSTLTTKVEIALRSSRNHTRRRFIDAARWVEDYDINKRADRALIVTRGRSFVLPLPEGPVQQLGRADGVRYQHARFIHDDESVIVVSDEDGSLRLELYDGKSGELRNRLDLELGRPSEIKANPRNAKVAIKNQKGDLLLVDLEKGTVNHVAHAAFTLFNGWDWSPDGRWLAFSALDTPSLARIVLYDSEELTSYFATRGDSFDVSPSFDPEGRYLYFLSSIVDEPVYDSGNVELGFPMGLRPFALILRKGNPSPLEMKIDDDYSDPSHLIDPVGIERRIVAIPVPTKRYKKVEALSGDTLLLLSEPPTKGRWWESYDSPTASIDSFNLKTKQLEVYIEKATDFSVSQLHKYAICQVGQDLRLGRDTAIDLGRIKLRVDPRAEWRQMFRETWQKQRDYFWTEEMNGIDWTRMSGRYEPLLGRIGTRSELSDLLKELQGELGNGHAMERGGDYPSGSECSQGSLGAELTYDSATKSYLIERIIRGDSWDCSAFSPLEAAGVNEGERIVAIDNQRTTQTISPNMLLINKAGSDTVVRIACGASGKERDVVLRPLGDERMLRYRAWIESNRERVHERSSGRLGYLHMPDMFTSGYTEFRRYYLSEVRREGLIVDVRYNRGGHTSYLILERLARRRLGHEMGRWTRKIVYPPLSPGPLAAITNQFCGSDGEVFTHGFKLLGLGPVIGTRTGGALVGLCRFDPLLDGGLVTQPERAQWFEDVGYGLENRGVEPDILVEITPEQAGVGDDPQLDRAIEEALARCELNFPLLKSTFS